MAEKVGKNSHKVGTNSRKVGGTPNKVGGNSDKVAPSKSKKLTGRLNIRLPQEAKPTYELIKEIKKSPLYDKTGRDVYAREFIAENGNNISKNHLVPGQLILFNYFEPKTMEDLEYYDAQPCTIFFGLFNSNQGKRYLGFNIHYYPPKLRYMIMNKIFEIYRPVWTKYFTEGITKEVDAFDYKYLMQALKRQNLDFGVRMYIPSLVGDPTEVPPNMWQVAVFTEGNFKKETRQQIMRFWTKWERGSKKKEAHPKYKSRTKSSK